MTTLPIFEGWISSTMLNILNVRANLCNVQKLIIIILLLYSFNLLGQEEEEYPSAEETEYYQSKKYPPSNKKVSKKVVKRYNLPYLKVRKSKNETNHFSSVWDRTPYQEVYHLLRDSCASIARQTNSWGKSYYSCIEYVDSLQYSTRIADVPLANILRVDDNNNPGILLYTKRTLEHRNLGYWIKILQDGLWKDYYTGLTANHYFYFKPNSTINFQLENDKLQIEGAKVRLTEQEVLPFGAPKFEPVQDHLIIELDLAQIIRDSDGDGLTDILETKYGTNPKSIDSDKDGIDDLDDKNPLSIKSDSPIIDIYNYLINNPSDSCLIVEGKRGDCQSEPNLESEMDYLIVSDIPELKSISPEFNRLIILTTDEFEEYSQANPISLERLYLTPIFKVDNANDTYKVSIGGSGWDYEYIIKKLKNGWLITLYRIMMV
jgi:hypothetical protein